MFAPGSGTSGEAPTVVTKDEALDLGGAPLQDPEPALVAEMSPPSMSDDAFDQKYKNMEMNTVLITMGSGQNLTCKLVDDKVFLSSATKTRILGASSPNSKPLLLYAGGSWLSEDSKAGAGCCFASSL